MASVGDDRECVWKAVQAGRSGVRRLRGVTGIPDDLLLGATVDIELPDPYTLKVLPMTERIVGEAVADAAVDFANVDPERFGCYFAGHMGDTVWVAQQRGLCPPRNLVREQGVRADGHVTPMLLHRGHRKHDRYVPAQGSHIGPCKVGQLHECPLWI